MLREVSSGLASKTSRPSRRIYYRRPEWLLATIVALKSVTLYGGGVKPNLCDCAEDVPVGALDCLADCRHVALRRFGDRGTAYVSHVIQSLYDAQ